MDEQIAARRPVSVMQVTDTKTGLRAAARQGQR
jgi:hypothetical protein